MEPHRGQEKKIHLLNWQTVTSTKEEGGLRILNLRKRIKSLHISLAWRLIKNKESLWSKLLTSKYLEPNKTGKAIQVQGFGNVPRKVGIIVNLATDGPFS